MMNELLALRRRPYIISECLLCIFLLIFLVLSGPRFGKFATLFGGLSLLVFILEAMIRGHLARMVADAKPLIPYMLFVLLSLLVLPLIPYAGSRVWNNATGMLTLGITFTIARRWGKLPLLYYAYPLVVCALCFLMFVAPSLVGAEGSTSGSRANYKATGLGEGGGLLASHFSVIVGIAVFLSLQYMFDKGMSFRNLFKIDFLFHGFSILLGFYLIVIQSGSRQGLLWLFMAAMLCYVVYSRKNLFIGALLLLPVAIIFPILMYVFFKETETVSRILVLFDPVAQTFDPEKSLETRVVMIEIGLDLWKQSPIWGNGNEAFRVNAGFGAYSHNNYIEMLSNYGLLGLFTYYLPLISGLCISLKGFFRNHQNELKIGFAWVAFCIVSILLSNIFMPSYYMKHMLMFMGILLGRLYYLKEMEGRMHRQARFR